MELLYYIFIFLALVLGVVGNFYKIFDCDTQNILISDINDTMYDLIFAFLGTIWDGYIYFNKKSILI